MKLYSGAESGNSWKIRILLDQLGVPYEKIMIDLLTWEHKTKGFALLPQSTFILKDAEHPNAAKLWIDFILSEQGQELVTSKEALISGRTDFKSPIPQIAPDLGSLKIIHVDWQSMSAATLKEYRDEWESIFTP